MTTVALGPYLDSLGDFTSALNALQAEHAAATIIEVPYSESEFVLTGEFSTLRSDIWLKGVGGGKPRIVKDFNVGGWGTPWAYEEAASLIRMSDLHVIARNVNQRFGAVIEAYFCTDVDIWDCIFESESITEFGTKMALGLIGAQRARVWSCKFIRAQVAFAGYGHGCDDIEMWDIEGIDVNDFLASAVTDAGQSITRVYFHDITINGMVGSGGLFIGSDGAVSDADEVSDIRVENVSVTGPFGGYFPDNQPTAVLVIGGVQTHDVAIRKVTASRSDARDNPAYGVRVIPTDGMVSQTSLTIEDCHVGYLGSQGITGIEAQGWTGVDIRRCSSDRNRGIRLVGCSDVFIEDTGVTNATSDGLNLDASDAPCDNVVLRGSSFESVGDFRYGLLVDCDTSAALDIDDCEFYGPNSAGVTGSGSCSIVRRSNNTYDPDPNAAFTASLTAYERKRFAASVPTPTLLHRYAAFASALLNGDVSASHLLEVQRSGHIDLDYDELDGE